MTWEKTVACDKKNNSGGDDTVMSVWACVKQTPLKVIQHTIFFLPFVSLIIKH